MTERELYIRYLKLHEVTFPLIPKEDWPQFYQDLLILEGGLVFGNCIGESNVLPFNFEVTSEAPIKEKPIAYPDKARQWAKNYVNTQIDLGVLSEVVRGRDPEPTFICNAVLVKEGQSQQDFRFCGNFIPANARIKTPASPMTDCQSTLDGMQDCVAYCAVDAKAGFHNVVVPPHLRRFLGIIIQDGLYQYNRMPFGTCASAAHFQALMNYILNKPPHNPKHSTLLDDVSVGGSETHQLWLDALVVMARMICAGIPINIKKCQFMTASLKMLGYIICSNTYQLGTKSIKKLFGSDLPRTRRQLQALLGKLNFASLFIPDYRRKIKPLLQLLNKTSDGKWTKIHTDTLNQMAQLVCLRMKLGLVDMNADSTLYIDEDGKYITCIMTQGEGEDLVINYMVSREFTITEAKQPRMERLLVGASWAVSKLGKYTYYLPNIYISFPLPAELCLASTTTKLPPRLQAKIIELTSLRCKFVQNESAWEFLELVEGIKEEPIDPNETKIDTPEWQHEDIQIPGASKTAAKLEQLPNEYYLLQFDGGCQKKLGSGGFVLWDPTKHMSYGGYKYYGSSCNTNNHAEAQALVDGLEATLPIVQKSGVKNLVVQGDSALVISFMKKEARPGAEHLVPLIQAAGLAVKQLRGVRVIFQHIPRECNEWADFLGRVGQREKDSGVWHDLDHLASNKPPTHNQQVCFTQHTSGQSKVCGICSELVEDKHPMCGGCGQQFHYTCLEAQFIPCRRGPWHCKACMKFFERQNIKDITLDEHLLKYLSHAELPSDPRKAQRVLKTSNWIWLSQYEQLWCRAPQASHSRRIPPICQREEIIKQALASSNHANGHTLYEIIKVHYWWNTLLTDCIAVANSSLPRQKVLAKFRSPPYLYPPTKGSKPFTLWSADTIVKLTPPSPTGANNVILFVDPFTKWVEVEILQELDSEHTQRALHDRIICRYGDPHCIRTDKGSEYRGRFTRYLAQKGIQHRFISTHHPRSNGQAERTVQTVKQGIAKQLEQCEGARWWEVLQDVAFAIRIAVSKATKMSPYLLVFKQQPLLPLANALYAEDVDAEATLEGETEQAITYWKHIFAQVQENQLKYDKQMVDAYKRRRDLADNDIRFVFEPGDLTLLRSKEPGKAKCRAVGPYHFVEYIPPRGVVAKIMNDKGKVYTVSAANLLPVRTDGAERMLRYTPGWDLDQKDPDSPFASSSESSISSVEPDNFPNNYRIVPT